MFCPKCKAEYRDEIKECADCKVPLVEQLPPEKCEGQPDAKLVSVYKTGNKGIILLAKSILESAEIYSYAKGEGIQDLFALGQFGTGFNPLVGPIEILVHEKDAEHAKELLSEIEDNTEKAPQKILPF